MAKTTVIGLDIGTTHVRAAEMEFGTGGPGRGAATLQRFGEIALPSGAVRDAEVVENETVATALRTLWSRGKFSTKNVVIGVGNQRVMVREVDLPWMPMEQLRASLPYQVQELLPVAADQALLDFYPTSESTGERGRTVHGLLVAAIRETVTSNVLTCESAGLAPQMVDLNAFAITRGLTQGEHANTTLAFADIGARVTNVIVARSGVPVLVRTIASGGQDATDAVASSMQVTASDAERLKREIGVGYTTTPDRQDAADGIATVTRSLIEAIRNTLTFYTGKNPTDPIERLVLTGGGAHLPGLGQFLASATRLPVVLGNPLEGLTIGRGVNRSEFAGRESLMALPIGLAFGVAS